jgi:hypothetical protein
MSAVLIPPLAVCNSDVKRIYAPETTRARIATLRRHAVLCEQSKHTAVHLPVVVSTCCTALQACHGSKPNYTLIRQSARSCTLNCTAPNTPFGIRLHNNALQCVLTTYPFQCSTHSSRRKYCSVSCSCCAQRVCRAALIALACLCCSAATLPAGTCSKLCCYHIAQVYKMPLSMIVHVYAPYCVL